MKIYDEDDLDAARAEGRAAGLAEGRASAVPSAGEVDAAFRRGMAAGATVERERIKSVLASPAAKSDPVTAARLALSPDTTPQNLAANLKHVADARQIAANASWDEVISEMNAKFRR